MSFPSDLKPRMHAREPLHVAFGRLGLTADELAALWARDAYDLMFVDAQHAPYDDAALHALCRLATEQRIPVVMRLIHPRQVWQIGHFLDLGLTGVVIPQTESPEVVAEAVESFYYPPLGRRSFGPGRALGWSDHSQGHEYADWWNETGVLILQIETLAGVLDCRSLVQPGVDMITFGANDLELDLRRYAQPILPDFQACVDHVVAQCADLDVKVGVGTSPLGRL